MAKAPPKLHLHATGQYMVKWGGRERYLGRDLADAQLKYSEELRAWGQWRAGKAANRTAAPRGAGVRLVRELIDEWLATKLANNGPRNERYNRANLARFGQAYGDLPISLIDAAKVEAIKAAMQEHDPPFKARTINHDVGSIRDFLRWVMKVSPRAMTPFDLSGIKKVRVRKSPPNAQPPTFVDRYIRAIEQVNPLLGPWMRLQYLAGLRPVEVPRVVHRLAPAHWHRAELGRHVLAIENKTERATEDFRYVVLTSEAAKWLRKCKPIWSRSDSYSAAVARAWDGDPIGSGACKAFHRDEKPRDFPIEFLRDSAYQRLMDSGVEFNTARALMGHVVPGSWGNYTHAPWHKWRKLMARLTLPRHRSPVKKKRPSVKPADRDRAAAAPVAAVQPPPLPDRLPT